MSEESTEGYLEGDYLVGEYLIGQFANRTGVQVQQTIEAEAHLGVEVGDAPIISQATGVEVLHSKLRHALHGVYLKDGGYLEDSYLAAQYCAFLGAQVSQQIFTQDELGVQAQMQIVDQTRRLGVQAQMQIVDFTKSLSMETLQIRVTRLGLEVEHVLYNIKRLRIMCEFPSRGDGTNWTATNQASGDFGPDNVNTDVIEQVFRSSGVSVTLTCDTGLAQGTPIDTIAILGHNLTRSATIQVQGSQDGTFSPPDVTFDFTEVTPDRAFYIAPTAPTAAAQQNRYWRFVINDTPNPDGYIEIGVIVFGEANVFSFGENYNNRLRQGFTHFKDTLPSEGFTTTSNDRALRKYLKIDFEELNYRFGNFSIIDEMVNYARTSLKCLVIPTPEYPERFAVFGKLNTLPEYVHNSIDEENEYVSFTLEWDEAL